MDPQSSISHGQSGSSTPGRRLAAATRAIACAAVLIAWFSVASCIVTADDSRAQIDAGPGVSSYGTFVPDLPVSHPPYNEFHASWKQRLDQPYIYLEHHGSYADTGSILPVVVREMRLQGLEPSGAPFCLFYDDPATTPDAEQRSRACIPIADQRSPITPLRYDVLPSRTVVHAFVSGPYPEVPRSYPYLLEHMRKLNFQIAGPIRESYIVPPSAIRAPGDYLCEVQVPVQMTPR